MACRRLEFDSRRVHIYLSKAETMLAINDANNPNALINRPVKSNICIN